MTRRDLAFLVSRAMAVLVAMRLIEMLGVAPVITQIRPDLDRRQLAGDIAVGLAVLIPLLAQLALAIYLWVGADRVALHWKGVDGPVGEMGETLRVVAFGAVGLYFAITGFTSAIWLTAGRIIVERSVRDKVAGLDSIGPSTISAFLGLAIVWYSMRPDAGFFRWVRSTIERVSLGARDLWHPYGRDDEDEP